VTIFFVKPTYLALLPLTRRDECPRFPFFSPSFISLYPTASSRDVSFFPPLERKPEFVLSFKGYHVLGFPGRHQSFLQLVFFSLSFLHSALRIARSSAIGFHFVIAADRCPAFFVLVLGRCIFLSCHRCFSLNSAFFLSATPSFGPLKLSSGVPSPPCFC